LVGGLASERRSQAEGHVGEIQGEACKVCHHILAAVAVEFIDIGAHAGWEYHHLLERDGLVANGESELRLKIGRHLARATSTAGTDCAVLQWLSFS